MKAIILAAGQGTRLRPLTDEVPKCMVSVNGISILEHALKTLNKVGIVDISVVCGYKEEKITSSNFKKYINARFEETNMVYSFFCAQEEFNDDIILCYGDIIFDSKIPEALLKSTDDFAVIVDKEWQKQWALRMEDPLTDAESMKVDKQNNIIELGKKAKYIDEIEGQYIGMVKISKKILPKIIDFYNTLDKNALYNGQTFEKMYVTDFIQLIIDKLMPAKAVWVSGGWFEVDSCNDLKIINEQFDQIIK